MVLVEELPTVANRAKRPPPTKDNNARPDARTSPAASMDSIPEFTPEQWAWLQAQTRELEASYVPTRSLIPCL